MSERNEQGTPTPLTLAALDRVLNPPNSNTSTITVNAGGVGVWVSSTACMIMLVMNIVLGFAVMNQSRKIDDLNTYLTAIYMLAPQLKPEK